MSVGLAIIEVSRKDTYGHLKPILRRRVLLGRRRVGQLVKTFVAVFSTPDETPVFWGAFSNFPDAHTAVEQWVEDHPYWAFEDFTIAEHPFGVLL